MKVIPTILLFAACCAVSLFGWYVVASLSLASAGPIMGSGSRSLSTGESVTFFTLLALPIFLFPSAAWFFRERLGRLAIPFGLTPILLPILFFSLIDFLR